MSGAGQSEASSSKAVVNKNGLLRSSSPARVKQKSSSSSLSSQLSAHLAKPVTPRAAIALSNTSDSPPSSTERRPHISVQQSGKAVASAADVEDLAHSELWKTNAAKKAEKAWAIHSEKGLQSDAKFKKYTIAVEKSLATFESVSEWADFIAFLGRLLKTFQLSPSFNAIPKKLIVAKRLSQCLNPALPSGVHQRALDVYEHILTVIGREGLRRDLLIWSPGLMPFFQYASTSVKPIVLSIFERHYLALGQDLRPVMRAFLLAGLPGLEEETNEFFDRVLRLLDQARDSIGQAFFFQNLFFILISSPEARLPALNYLVKRLPKLNGDDIDWEESVKSIIGSDLGLLVRGFAAALEDETSLLVRRAALDILVTHLRLDSVTWKNLVVQKDKIRLIKAALAVVLRRDLSLNRRLYAWILGPSEDISAQKKYFEENAQKLSRLAILSDLIRCPLVQVEEKDRAREGIERQRPYKIFVSLLDKWSIGQPLTNVLILDTYHCMQRQMEAVDDERISIDTSLKAAATDITTAAKMLFEVVDPFVTYRRFYYAIIDEIKGTQTTSFSAILLLRFVLKSFRVHDEESRQIHLPVLLSVLLELLDDCKNAKVKADAIHLALTLLALIPRRIFIRTEGQALIDVSFADHAKTFYESDSSNADEAAQRYIGFQHPSTQSRLLQLSSHIPDNKDESDTSTLSLLLFSHLLRILDSTLDIASEEKQVSIQWDANDWVQNVLPRTQTAQHFEQFQAYTIAIVDSAKCRALERAARLGKIGIAPILLTKLLVFLQPQWNPFHTRTVELLWSVADLAKGRYIESLLCKGLTSSSSSDRRQTLDVFGAIWQYSSEERLASRSITEPLLQVLDNLRSLDWNERQASERWIKANVRGYTLFLDPLLEIIIKSGLERQTNLVKYKDRSFAFHKYSTAFDHEQVIYALGIMLQLAKFGGQVFVKALRSVQIKRSHFRSIVAAYDLELDSSYLRILLTSLLLFIRTDASLINPYLEAYTKLHVLAAELLQAIIQRGSLQGNWLTEVEGALLERLYISIQRKDHAVQANLLQALQSVIRAKTTEGTSRDSTPHSLLIIVIRDGISNRSNLSMLSNWTEFILSIVPYYRSALTLFLLPLNEIICQLLVSSVTYHHLASYSQSQDGQCQMGESELISLMSINERLLLQCLDSADHVEENGPTTHIANPEKTVDSSGLMGALTNVFQADSSNNNTGVNMTTSPNSVLQTLHHSIRSLHVVWTAFSGELPLDAAGEAKQQYLQIINPRIKARCRRSFEKVYRNNSGEVVESLIDCWNTAGGVRRLHIAGTALTTSTAGLDHRAMEATFDILSTLAPSAQIVVTFLCDVISTRTTSSAAASSTNNSEKMTNRKSSTPIVSESILMSFWEAYMDRLDSAASIQVWPVVIMLVKDILHNSSAHKAQMYPILRCFTVTGEKIVNTSIGNEDKRIKRELIDNYLKLCDFTILIAGRSFDQTNWIGRRAALAINDEDVEDSGRATPTNMTDDKMGTSITDLGSTNIGSSSLIDSINEYLADRVLPALRLFGVDQDKVLAICTNVVYYIITPVIRQRRKMLEVPLSILKLLTEVTKLPGTIRAWKNVVADVFQDTRFFQMRGETGLQWLPIVLALLNSDKERFVELIAKVTSTPSTNIFTNKEAETMIRGSNLKRIAGVIYAADKDHWLTHLPPLQEKLVELLRNGTTDPIGTDVYLCLRVLLLRFSSRHLSAFWPVIITELMRLFEGCLDDEMPSSNDIDALQLIFSACKFLDLLLTLQTNDFQIHQWLFITDTVDIVYPPLEWSSDSILDRMASALLERKSSSKGNKGKIIKSSTKDSYQQGIVNADIKQINVNAEEDDEIVIVGSLKHRPQLINIGSTISTIEVLQPFFSQVSLYAFEQTFNCGQEIDWLAIEQSIETDLFPLHVDE